jgi:hypothetical protein
MRNLSEEELGWIEQRAELQFRFGDPTALRPEDVADLILEVKELHVQRRHLIALNRQQTGYLEAP